MRRSAALYVLCFTGFAGLASAVGCGRNGTSPTGPGTGPEPVAVLDGRTGNAVPSLVDVQALPGDRLVLNAPGFLTLQTSYRGAPVLLWPNDAALPVSVTRALVYQDKEQAVLVRWTDGIRLNLVPDGTVRSLPWAMTRIENAAAVVSRIHPAVGVGVDGAGATVPVTLGPDDEGFRTYPNAAAVAYVRWDGSGRATDARIVLRSLDRDGFWHGEGNFQTAMIHEIIHATGLVGHLPDDAQGTMSATGDSYRFPEPTAAETLIMRLHYARLAGTTLTGDVENEGGRVGTSGVERSTWHLVCAR